jgi:hypothetical protein
MLLDVVGGPAPLYRTGAMQDFGYGLPRILLLLGTSVNKEGKGPHRAVPSMIREWQ